MANPVIDWAKDNPIPAGVGIVVIGGLLLYLFSGSSGSADNGNGAAVAAYYGAVAQQGISGNALQATQIQQQALTARTLIAAQVATNKDNVWSAQQLEVARINTAGAVALAPYQLQGQYINTLGRIAQKPGAVVTETKKSNGFFGIGGGSSTSSKYVADPAAVQAGNVLSQWQPSLTGGPAIVNFTPPQSFGSGYQSPGYIATT